MLGLNWETQRALLDGADKRSAITKAINVIKEAEDSGAETIGDMEAQRVVLEQELVSKRKDADNFVVREDYADLERQLYLTDTELHDLINENHSDNQLLRHYLDSAKEAPEADSSRPIEILRSAGAVFKDSTLKSIEDVSQFHAQVYRNRKAFLDDEVARLRRAVRVRGQKISELSGLKSNILDVLRSSGALGNSHTDSVGADGANRKT